MGPLPHPSLSLDGPKSDIPPGSIFEGRLTRTRGSHLFNVPIEWFFHGLGEASNGHEDVMTKPDALQLAR